MRKILKDMFTGKDNQTYSALRIGWFIMLIHALALSSYDVYVLKAHFDMQSFGIMVGAIVAAGGIALGQAAKTEPGVGG